MGHASAASSRRNLPIRLLRAISCPWRAAGLLFATLALLNVAACSSFREIYPTLDGYAANGQFDQAVAVIEKNKAEYGDRNAVLYNLDRGTMLHYAGKWAESNKAFEAAEKRMDELYTESITGNVAAFAVNDNLLPYRGEDFESVVVNIYQALNWIQLGNIENALVHARKVDQKLDFINRSYDVDKKNVYKEDAFARMLMGALYEISGSRDDLNDAFTSDRLATGIYDKDFSVNYGTPAPGLLGANLLTTASFMGRDELEQAQKRFSAATLITPQDKRAKYGQLYIVHFAGHAPVKYETGFTGVYGTYLVKVVFPAYRPVRYVVTGSQVLMDGEVATVLDPAEPIGPIAIKNLDNRKTRIYAKAIARAGAKLAANALVQQQARKQGGEGAGLLAAVLGGAATAASEQADLRCWQTLPDRILFGRVLMPAGKHKLSVQFLTGQRAVVSTRDFGEVEVPPGKTRFILLHSNR